MLTSPKLSQQQFCLFCTTLQEVWKLHGGTFGLNTKGNVFVVYWFCSCCVISEAASKEVDRKKGKAKGRK